MIDRIRIELAARIWTTKLHLEQFMDRLLSKPYGPFAITFAWLVAAAIIGVAVCGLIETVYGG